MIICTQDMAQDAGGRHRTGIMLKKAILLVSGNALGSALLLLRNLIVARLISPEDYGIAATFAIAMSVVEMLSYFGLNQMIVVDRDGDEPDFQAAMQGFQVLRGLFSSLVLFAIAHPYARFLGIEQVAWAYQVIAAIPLINGLQHFDMHRLKRHMRFAPSVIANVVPALVSVLAVWPLAVLYGDYRIMLVALMIQAAAMVVLSHWTAERRYRLRLDFALMRRATVFGWPLLLNGALLFGVFNGERLIVGREMGMAQLAVFSMAMTLTLTPTLVLAGSCQSFFLPQLSALRDRTEAFQRLGIAAIEAGLVIGLMLILGTSLLGGPVVHLLLGAKFDAILPILVPIAVLQAVRVAKTGGSLVALARERSGNAVIANLFRIASLPLSWLVAIRTGDMLAIIWIATAAEVMGFLTGLWLTRGRVGMRLAPLMLPAVLSAVACVVVVIDAGLHPPQPGLAAHLHPLHWIVGLSVLAALAAMGGLRGYLWRRLA